MDQFWSAPPVSRTLTLCAFIESLACHGQFLSTGSVIFLPRYIFKIFPELWRLFTPFLLTGSGFSFLFDLYMIYTYASQLETGSPRFSTPGSFFIYILFVALIILLKRFLETREITPATHMLTAGCYLGGVVFTHALIMAFIWTHCQDNKHKKINFFVINIPALLAPWAMLVLTMVTAGWYATLQQGMGLVAAHMYDFLTRIYPRFGGGRNWIVTPQFVKKLFTTHTPWGEYRSYGTAYRPETQGQTSESATWSSSFQNQWSSRGQGRRLGGE